MNKIASSLAAVTLSATFAATAALADDYFPGPHAMGAQAISQITTHAGYDVVDIDLEDGVYEVKAFDQTGKLVELRYRADDAKLLSVQELRSGSASRSTGQ